MTMMTMMTTMTIITTMTTMTTMTLTTHAARVLYDAPLVGGAGTHHVACDGWCLCAVALLTLVVGPDVDVDLL